MLWTRSIQQIKNQIRYYGKTRVKSEFDGFDFYTNYTPISESDYQKLIKYVNKQDYIDFALVIRDADTLRFDAWGNSKGLPVRLITMDSYKGQGKNEFLYVKFKKEGFTVTEELIKGFTDWITEEKMEYEIIKK